MQLTVRISFKVRIISSVEHFKNFCAWYKYNIVKKVNYQAW